MPSLFPSGTWKLISSVNDNADGYIQYFDSHNNHNTCIKSESIDPCITTSNEMTEKSSLLQFKYRMTAIDIGPKPVTKLIEKIKTEEDICTNAAFILKQNIYN